MSKAWWKRGNRGASKRDIDKVHRLLLEMHSMVSQDLRGATLVFQQEVDAIQSTWARIGGVVTILLTEGRNLDPKLSQVERNAAVVTARDDLDRLLGQFEKQRELMREGAEERVRQAEKTLHPDIKRDVEMLAGDVGEPGTEEVTDAPAAAD